MGTTSSWKVRLFTLSVMVALAATAALGAGCSGDDGGTAVECESASDYFAKNVWRVVESKCSACHNAQGVARETRYVLKSSAEAGFIQHNLEVIRDLALTEQEGKSYWLLKPTLQIAHEGGRVIDPSSDDYKAMLGLIVRLKSDEQCDSNQLGEFTGVEMKDATSTLRSAALILARRLPTAEELQRVEAGGYPALERILDEMMTEEAFFEFLKTSYGDILETDFYLNNDAAGAIGDTYADAFWYETAQKEQIDQYGLADLDELRRFTQVGIAREPLELIKWVAKHDLPFTEIMTADYMMFTPLSARSYGAEMIEDFEDPNNPLEFKPGRLPAYAGEGNPQYTDYPHAGILSSPMFLNRWPTTPTNRNRARARVTMLFFLGSNILLTADQPVDQTKVTAINPQRDDPACVVCHAVVDPIAGAYQAFDDQGEWTPEPVWFSEMWPAGFGDEKLPLEQAAYGVRWLADRVARDERFALGVVLNLYTGLTGRAPLMAPDDYEDAFYDAKFKGYLLQSNTFAKIAKQFVDSDYNVKKVVKALVLSPYFRAINSVPLSQEELVSFGDVGSAHLLTPEQLHFKILAVLGIPWGSYTNPNLSFEPRDPGDAGRFQLYYGGLDHDEVTKRITDPNGLMAAVAERMSVEMSCTAVPVDFARAPEERKLFPEIAIDGVVYDPLNLEPESGGLAVPQAQQGIKQTIVHLHHQILGEQLNVDHPEVERTYSLFVETWREGKDKMSDDELGTNLPWSCQRDTDFYTGQPLPEGREVVRDEKFTVRAWMAVMTYLLSDYRFLYE